MYQNVKFGDDRSFLIDSKSKIDLAIVNEDRDQQTAKLFLVLSS